MPTKFTLRFHDAQTHELLGIVADQMGFSKNQLAEQILKRELRATALMLAASLDETAQRLRSYDREASLDGDIQAIAEAEVTEDDPAEGEMIPAVAMADSLGVGQIFAR